MLVRAYVLWCTIVLVSCKRQPKIFSFNFLEDRDITVDLDFSIPFITIPIKKNVDSFGSTGLPSININPAALALGGAVVLGTTVMVPLILKSYAAYSVDRYTRVIDKSDFTMDSIVNFAKSLSDGRGLRGCTLRIACWSAKQEFTDTTRVIQFIANNKIVSSFINATAIEDAMLSGRNGRDCMTYTPCLIQEQHMPMLMQNLAVITRAYG